MPLMWVAPELFHEYRGIKIYQAYKDGEADNPLTWWFTWDIQENGELWDVRELPYWNETGIELDSSEIRLQETMEHYIEQCLTRTSCNDEDALPWQSWQTICGENYFEHDHTACEYRFAVQNEEKHA